MFFQSIEMRRPELAVARQPRVEFEEGLGPDAVQPALSIGASLDQSRVPEHPEMLRHGRLAQPQMCHQLSHRSFAFAQQIEDRLPSRLGQNLECRRRSHTLSMLKGLYICQGMEVRQTLRHTAARIDPWFHLDRVPAASIRGRDPCRDYAEAGTAGASGAADGSSCSSRGSHSSQRGRYQLRSPSSFIVAGRSTARTSVASIRIAAASPTPNCLS